MSNESDKAKTENIVTDGLDALNNDVAATVLLLSTNFMGSISINGFSGDDVETLMRNPLCGRLIDLGLVIQQVETSPNPAIHLDLTPAGKIVAHTLEVQAAVQKLKFENLDVLFTIERLGIDGVHVPSDIIEALFDNRSIAGTRHLVQANLLTAEVDEAVQEIRFELTQHGKDVIAECRKQIDTLIPTKEAEQIIDVATLDTQVAIVLQRLEGANYTAVAIPGLGLQKPLAAS